MTQNTPNLTLSRQLTLTYDDSNTPTQYALYIVIDSEKEGNYTMLVNNGSVNSNNTIYSLTIDETLAPEGTGEIIVDLGELPVDTSGEIHVTLNHGEEVFIQCPPIRVIEAQQEDRPLEGNDF